MQGRSVGGGLHMSGRALCHSVLSDRNPLLLSDEAASMSQLWGHLRLNNLNSWTACATTDDRNQKLEMSRTKNFHKNTLLDQIITHDLLILYSRENVHSKGTVIRIIHIEYTR